MLLSRVAIARAWSWPRSWQGPGPTGGPVDSDDNQEDQKEVIEELI